MTISFKFQSKVPIQENIMTLSKRDKKSVNFPLKLKRVRSVEIITSACF